MPMWDDSRPDGGSGAVDRGATVSAAFATDTESRIKVGADGKSLDESDVKWIVSPYDEYAL